LEAVDFQQIWRNVLASSDKWSVVGVQVIFEEVHDNIKVLFCSLFSVVMIFDGQKIGMIQHLHDL
jgi:hypothetical protein